MEKVQQKKRSFRAAVFPVIAALVTLWWLMPIRILKGYQPEDITRIDVESAVSFSVTNKREIRSIAENLYTCGAVRRGISFGRMGSVYNLYLYAGDTCVRKFCVIDTATARDSVFFYKPKNGDLIYCKKYLDRLAEKYNKPE